MQDEQNKAISTGHNDHKLTVSECMDILGVSEKTVRRMISSGQLESVIIKSTSGRVRLISANSVKKIQEIRSQTDTDKTDQRTITGDMAELLKEMQELKAQNKDLTAEVHELKAIVHNMTESVLKALPPVTQNKKPWWKIWKQ